MLILSRKVGESILVGEGIEVKILPGTNRNRVVVGIRAPGDVKVFRKELISKGSKKGSSIGEGGTGCP